jgi:hypothetical protein
MPSLRPVSRSTIVLVQARSTPTGRLVGAEPAHRAVPVLIDPEPPQGLGVHVRQHCRSHARADCASHHETPCGAAASAAARPEPTTAPTSAPSSPALERARRGAPGPFFYHQARFQAPDPQAGLKAAVTEIFEKNHAWIPVIVATL